MRYLLPKVGMSFGEYFSGPRAQVEAQLKAGKWLLENIHSDYHRICVWPDYMFVEDAHSFGAEVVFPEDDGPWIARPARCWRRTTTWTTCAGSTCWRPVSIRR